MPYVVRWADIDANRHMTYAAYVNASIDQRDRFFSEHNLPPEYFEKLGVVPVFTSLNMNFLREVRMGETLTITFQLSGLSPQGLRWSILHEFLKANGKKAVRLSIEGTIINIATRQPVLPNPEIFAVFNEAPRTDDFEVLSERWRAG